MFNLKTKFHPLFILVVKICNEIPQKIHRIWNKKKI